MQLHATVTVDGRDRSRLPSLSPRFISLNRPARSPSCVRASPSNPSFRHSHAITRQPCSEFGGGIRRLPRDYAHSPRGASRTYRCSGAGYWRKFGAGYLVDADARRVVDAMPGREKN